MQPYKYKPLNTDNSELRLISLLPSTNVDDVISFSIFHAPFPCKYDPKAEDENTKDFLSRVNSGLKLGWTAFGVVNRRILYWNKAKGLLQFEHPGARSAVLRRYRPSISALEVDARIPSSVGLGMQQFEALSYVWGSTDNPVTVHVIEDDETQTTATKTGLSLTIRQNLAQALRHLRREDTPRILWIDAICINQEDLQERTAQVTHMGAIYRYAAGVVIWLGPSSATSSQALRDLTESGRSILMTLDDNFFANPDVPDDGYDGRHFSRLPESWLPAISELFARPWFGRLWTFQEALLGASHAVLQCGSESMPWEFLVHAVCRIMKDQDDRRYPLWFMKDLMGIVAVCQSQQVTSSIMSVCRLRACTDPRDKVYGVLSLLRPAISERITVDYNMQLQQLHREVFIAYLETTSRLDLMLSAGQGYHDPGCPSWMPPWTANFNSWVPTNAVLLSGSASGYTDAAWSTNQRHLNVMNFVGAKPLRVTWVSEPLETIHDMYSVMQKEVGAEMAPESLEALDVFVHFIYGGNFTERIQASPRAKSLQSCRREVLRHLDCYKGQCHHSKWGVEKHICKQQIERLNKSQKFPHPCRVFRTEDSCLGQCSMAAKVGDQVVVLLGCHVPMLLRPVSRLKQGIPQHHKLVGLCYMPSNMDGQVVLGPIPKPWQPYYICHKRRRQLIFFQDGYGKRCVARDDPRLVKIPVPKGWKELRLTLEDDLPDYQFDYTFKWKHEESGRVIRSDPRLLPKELIKRGIKLQTYYIA